MLPSTQQWFLKWGNQYFKYIFVQLLKTFFVSFAVISIRQLWRYFIGKENEISFFHPVKFIFILVILIPLGFHFHKRWKLLRLKYSLTSGATLTTKEKKLLLLVKRKYQTWLKRKLLLILLNATLVPLIFLFFLYMLLGIKKNDFTPGSYLNEFEPGALPLIILIFYVLGVFLVWKYWTEYLRRNYVKILELS